MVRAKHSSTNISCEPYPWEWQEDQGLAQSFNAVRVVSLVQLVFTVLGYAAKYATFHYTNDHFRILYDLQAPGGISGLSIIAALILRHEGDGQRSLLICKIYSALTGLDFIAWAASAAYSLYELVPGYEDGLDLLDRVRPLSMHVFVGILLLVCLVEGLRVVRKASHQQYSLLSDSEVMAPAQTSLDYRVLRKLCIVQLTYTLFGAIATVVGAYLTTDLGSLTLLLTPGAGVFTILACLSVFFSLFGNSLPTNYSIMISIDLITGLMRVAGAFTYGLLKYPDAHDPDNDPSKEAFFIPGAIWAAFPVFYWLLGIIIAYRTRVHIEMNKNLSTQVDGVFAI